MATAQVEERQLLKAMTWWDGFVVALANPGFLIAGLGGSIAALGTTGSVSVKPAPECVHVDFEKNSDCISVPATRPLTDSTTDQPIQ